MSTAPIQTVVSEIRHRIVSGRYREGDWLPSERQIATEFGLHREVVRAAVSELADEGLIEVKPRCRPVVRRAARLGSASPSTYGHTARSRLIALLMWGIGFGDGPTPQELIFLGMNKALSAAGYHGVFLNLEDNAVHSGQHEALEAGHLKDVQSNGFGGLVFYAHAAKQNLSLIREISHRMPLVLIDREVPGVEADYVGVDNYRGAYDMATYLMDLGHRHMAYVTNTDVLNTVADRLHGFFTAVDDRLGDGGPETLVIGTAAERPWSALDAVFTAPFEKRPTAVMCVNGLEADRAARRLAALNLSIPGDVSVAGFDNAPGLLPNGVELTTVEQPFREIGEAAARCILQRIAKPNAPKAHVELATRLVVRDSTAPPVA